MLSVDCLLTLASQLRLLFLGNSDVYTSPLCSLIVKWTQVQIREVELFEVPRCLFCSYFVRLMG